MSGTSTIILTAEEEGVLAEFATWAEENAPTLAANAVWEACEGVEDRAAFLEAFGPFQRFWDWLKGIGNKARRDFMYAHMIDMLMNAILKLITGGAS